MITSLVTWFLGLAWYWKIILVYVSNTLLHYLLMARYYFSESAKFGSRVIIDKTYEEKEAYHLILNEHEELPPDAPLIVFESQTGLAAPCWSFLQNHLLGTLPTFSYQRLGYGWSSSRDNHERTAERAADELYFLLSQLGFVDVSLDSAAQGKQKRPTQEQERRPLILVGHSYGAIIMEALVQKYNPQNVLGVVLLDPPPLSMFDTYPELETFTTTKLPAVMGTAAALSDIGILRWLRAFFGVSMVQISPQLKSRLSPEDIVHLSEIGNDGRSIRTMVSEMKSFADSARLLSKKRQSEESKKSKAPPRALVTVEKVQEPMVKLKDVSPEDWKKWWHQEQEKTYLGTQTEKWIVQDPSSSHLELCVSEYVLDGIQLILDHHHIKSKVSIPNKKI